VGLSRHLEHLSHCSKILVIRDYIYYCLADRLQGFNLYQNPRSRRSYQTRLTLRLRLVDLKISGIRGGDDAEVEESRHRQKEII